MTAPVKRENDLDLLYLLGIHNAPRPDIADRQKGPAEMQPNLRTWNGRHAIPPCKHTLEMLLSAPHTALATHLSVSFVGQ